MESWKTIAKHSAALKNISNQERGLWAEKRLIRLLESQQFQILEQRCKMPHGEVDVFACRKNHYILFEVKYLDNEWRIFDRIKYDQIRRLQLNKLHCEQLYTQVSAYIVYVDQNAFCRFVNVNA